MTSILDDIYAAIDLIDRTRIRLVCSPERYDSLLAALQARPEYDGAWKLSSSPIVEGDEVIVYRLPTGI